MTRLFEHVTVFEWEHVLLLTDGRITRVLEPGRHRYRRSRASVIRVDRRPRVMSVHGQELLTGGLQRLHRRKRNFCSGLVMTRPVNTC